MGNEGSTEAAPIQISSRSQEAPDELLAKLKQLPKFDPLIPINPSIFPTSTQAEYDLTLFTLIQQHLIKCAQATAQNQKTVTAAVSELESRVLETETELGGKLQDTTDLFAVTAIQKHLHKTHAYIHAIFELIQQIDNELHETKTPNVSSVNLEVPGQNQFPMVNMILQHRKYSEPMQVVTRQSSSVSLSLEQTDSSMVSPSTRATDALHLVASKLKKEDK